MNILIKIDLIGSIKYFMLYKFVLTLRRPLLILSLSFSFSFNFALLLMDSYIVILNTY